MQKNWLDHWIRSHFLFRYTVACNQYPYLPIGAKVISTSNSTTYTSTTYKYLVYLENEQSYYEFSNRLRNDQIAYRPEVVRREDFWARLIEPDEYASLSCKWFWRLVRLGLLSVLSIYAPLNTLLSLIRGLIKY